jgi:hypothetical protein
MILLRWIEWLWVCTEKPSKKNKAEEKSIGMKILTTSGNTYTFEFGMVGGSKQRGTVTTCWLGLLNKNYKINKMEVFLNADAWIAL